MKENVIVSLADSNYFDLLNELVNSIKSFEESKNVAICILDAGLTENQKNILIKKIDKVEKANWDIEIPTYKVRGKEWLKSHISKAFLPRYFPGFKKYLWIDADAWVNSWEAIDLYFRGSDNNKLSISTSADRAYGRVLRVEWLIGGFAKIKSQNYKHAKLSGFSEKIARDVALKPHLNIGVFCLNVAAPHWDVWKKNLNIALKSGKIFGSEQIAMNVTIYVDKLDVEILPAYCNYTLTDGMKYGTINNTFVEPYLPNHKIGIIHLAGKNNDHIRSNKSFLSEVKTLDGKIIKKNLRFIE